MHSMTPKNQECFQRALKQIPWATQTNAKRHDMDGVTQRPPFIKRAKGCRLWDLDDREYIDFRAALGPITLGYQYQEIDDAVRSQMNQGVLFSMASPLEVEASAAILDTIKWADKIRFMKTGADVNACCIRLARSHTGRDHILTSGYHGYHDWFALGWPNPGVPQSLNDYIHSIEYADLEAIDHVFENHGHELAAVIVVPVEWTREPSKSYLEKLRSKCDEYGTLLIFDEVLTGFRLAKGGAQEFFGVTPDLAAYAKGIANGYPLSAYAGKTVYMDTLDQTIITTTYAGETLSLAAAKTVMGILNREPVIDHIFAMGKRLRQGFDTIFQETGYPAKTIGLEPAITIKFEGDTQQEHTRRAQLFDKLYQKGIFANKEWLISYSHQPSDIDQALDAMAEAVAEVAIES